MTHFFLPFIFSWCLLEIIVTGSSPLNGQKSYDYCDPTLKLCDNPKDHTMCKYPVAGLSPQCKNTKYEPFSSSDKEKILYLHNKCRSTVARGKDNLPPASNMRKMVWDDELEALARRWAEQCKTTTEGEVNDKCRNTKRFQVSQNVGSTPVTDILDKNALLLVNDWCTQGNAIDPSFVHKFPSTEGLKNFANMMQADTYAVGCARVLFQNGTQNIESLVCNYGPAEDTKEKPLYRAGTPCGDCPKGTKCSSSFIELCTTTAVTGKRIVRDGKEKYQPALNIIPMKSPGDTCLCAEVYISKATVTRLPSNIFHILWPLLGLLY